MNKKLVAGVAGILVAVAALGFAFGTTPGRAAEPAKQPPMMMQPGQMAPQAMAEMMKSPEMQGQCIEMMKNADMQQAMMNMMKQPEMQAAMKQMLQADASFRQMMSEMANSVDTSENRGGGAAPNPPAVSPTGDHESHHK